MSFLIGFLTFIMIVDCLLLILLILIQLPKKEAGAGLAFGGTATDALFGAGSGNMLTKITKYATVVFFLLAMTLAIMQSKYYHRSSAELQRLMEQQSKQPAAMTLPPTKPAATPVAPAALTNLELLPPAAATNPAAPAPATPAPASAPQK
jgi:preprotein translocase subunit SecG